MSDVELTINGTIMNIETKQTRNNTDWFTILVEMGESQYPVKAFGKTAVQFSESGAGVGDNIKASCRLESKEWQGKHFLDLVVENVKVVKTKADGGGTSGGSGKKSSFVKEPVRGDDNEGVEKITYVETVEDLEDLPF